MKQEHNRIVGLIAIALWIGALLAPSIAIAYRYGVETPIPRSSMFYLIWGWVGYHTGNPAWYANFPLFFMIGTLLFGRTPNIFLAMFSGLFSLTIFLPIRVSDVTWGGRGIEYVRGPAFWLWLGSFFVCVAFTMWAKWRSSAAARLATR